MQTKVCSIDWTAHDLNNWTGQINVWSFFGLNIWKCNAFHDYCMFHFNPLYMDPMTSIRNWGPMNYVFFTLATPWRAQLTSSECCIDLGRLWRSDQFVEVWPAKSIHQQPHDVLSSHLASQIYTTPCCRFGSLTSILSKCIDPYKTTQCIDLAYLDFGEIFEIGFNFFLKMTILCLDV